MKESQLRSRYPGQLMTGLPLLDLCGLPRGAGNMSPPAYESACFQETPLPPPNPIRGVKGPSVERRIDSRRPPCNGSRGWLDAAFSTVRDKNISTCPMDAGPPPRSGLAIQKRTPPGASR